MASLHNPPSIVFVANAAVFQKVAGLESAEGRQAAAEIALPQMRTMQEMLEPSVGGGAPTIKNIVVLDNVQDPGNVGTLLRSAAGLGWACVLLTGCCDLFNDKLIRAARGAAWRAPIAMCKFEEMVEELERARDTAVLVADMGGCSPEEAKERLFARERRAGGGRARAAGEARWR